LLFCFNGVIFAILVVNVVLVSLIVILF
jgi:hypothetical protein